MDDEVLEEHKALIKKLGTKALMDMFDISKGAISQWRKNGIPEMRLMYLKLSRPELFETKSSDVPTLARKRKV